MEVDHSTMQGAELRRLWEPSSRRLRQPPSGIRLGRRTTRARARPPAGRRRPTRLRRHCSRRPATGRGGSRTGRRQLVESRSGSAAAWRSACVRGGGHRQELGRSSDLPPAHRMLGDVESILDSLTDLAQSKARVRRCRAFSSTPERGDRAQPADFVDGSVATALHALGELERDHGRYSVSAELLEEALELWERGGHLRHAGETRHGLADLRLEQGETKVAVRLYRATLVQFRNEDNKRAIAYSLGGLAAAAAAAGQLERAGRLWGVVEQLEVQRGAPLGSFARARYRRFFATLDAETLEHEVGFGRALPLDEAIEFALGEDPPCCAKLVSRSESGRSNEVETVAW